MRRRLATALIASALAVATWVVHEAHPDRPHLDLGNDTYGVWTGRSYAYVINHTDALILVDAGSDGHGAALLAELKRLGSGPDAVQAILLTQGHRDHRAAAALFPNATVYAGTDDLAMALGDKHPRAPLALLISRLTRKPPPLAQVQAILPATRLRWGRLEIEAVGLPGVTKGSMGYRVGTLLFIGDSLKLKRDGVGIWSWAWSESPSHNRRILQRLQGLPFEGLADGHGGFAADGRERFNGFVQ